MVVLLTGEISKINDLYHLSTQEYTIKKVDKRVTIPRAGFLEEKTRMDHIFINVKEPSDALQLAKKTTVRSHVARRQWKGHVEAAKERKRKREDFLPVQIELDCSGLRRKQPLPPVASPPTSPSPRIKDDSLYVSSSARTAVSPPRPPTMIESFPIDPFQSCPVAWRPFLPTLVDFCNPHQQP